MELKQKLYFFYSNELECASASKKTNKVNWNKYTIHLQPTAFLKPVKISGFKCCGTPFVGKNNITLHIRKLHTRYWTGLQRSMSNKTKSIFQFLHNIFVLLHMIGIWSLTTGQSSSYATTETEMKMTFL